MREDLRKELEETYARRRAENEHTEEVRRTEIREKYPDIQRLKDQRQELLLSSVHGLGNGPAQAGNGLSLRGQVEEINRRIREGLKAAGLPEDYLGPVYHCPMCHDTGYTGNLVKEICSCFKDEYQKLLSRKIGLSGNEKECFASFNPDIIPDERENGKKYSQRELTCIAKDFCEKWANRYPDVRIHTIVFSGKTGLGKTFLMHAIAQRLIERGYSVLTISAFQFLQTARKSLFENSAGLDELIEAPVLMIDDLGSEPLMKNITIESLFTLINERQIHGLPTVLSSNLTTDGIKEHYTERIGSRITDPKHCMVITLEGKDLRKATNV